MPSLHPWLNYATSFVSKHRFSMISEVPTQLVRFSTCRVGGHFCNALVIFWNWWRSNTFHLAVGLYMTVEIKKRFLAGRWPLILQVEVSAIKITQCFDMCFSNVIFKLKLSSPAMPVVANDLFVINGYDLLFWWWRSGERRESESELSQDKLNCEDKYRLAERFFRLAESPGSPFCTVASLFHRSKLAGWRVAGRLLTTWRLCCIKHVHYSTRGKIWSRFPTLCVKQRSVDVSGPLWQEAFPLEKRTCSCLTGSGGRIHKALFTIGWLHSIFMCPASCMAEMLFYE